MARIPFFVFVERAERINENAHKRGVMGELTGLDLLLLWAVQDKKCAYTRRHLSDLKRASIDHIVPIAHGGANDLSNVVFVAKFENTAKQDWSLRDYCLLRGLDFRAIEKRIKTLRDDLRAAGALDG